MNKSIHLASLIAIFMCASVCADVIVPNYTAGVEADGTFSLTSTASAGRTYQMTISSSQLSSVIGEELIGMQFRLNGAASSWPLADANYAFWNIFIGPGVSPASMSNTFAVNFSGTSTQVRSGALSFTTGSFPSGSSPNNFGPTLTFNTPYLYTGGDLTVEMRFAQQTGATTQSPLDAVLASGGPGNGWGVDFAARWTGNADGTSGSNGNFLVTNFLTQSAVPEPSTMILAGASLASVVFWQRRRRSSKPAKTNTANSLPNA